MDGNGVARLIWASLAVSAALSVLCVAGMLRSHAPSVRVAVQQPFAGWPALGKLFDSGIDTPQYESPAAFWGNVAAWCDLPRVGPRNHSAACACLLAVADAFLKETSEEANASLDVPVTAAARQSYPGQAVACLRRRGAWRIWHFGWLHPAATALFCNLPLASFALGLAQHAAGWRWARGIAALPELAASAALVAADPLGNLLYAAWALCVSGMLL